MLKAVIDTNIWISALLKSPLTRPILEEFIEDKFVPIISNELLKELNDALNEPELTRLIESTEAKELIALIAEKSQKLKPSTRVNICRDAKDNFILSLAAESKATLVTLDKDLLVLSKEFDVLSPKEFRKQLKRK